MYWKPLCMNFTCISSRDYEYFSRRASVLNAQWLCCVVVQVLKYLIETWRLVREVKEPDQNILPCIYNSLLVIKIEISLAMASHLQSAVTSNQGTLLVSSWTTNRSSWSLDWTSASFERAHWIFCKAGRACLKVFLCSKLEAISLAWWNLSHLTFSRANATSHCWTKWTHWQARSG